MANTGMKGIKMTTINARLVKQSRKLFFCDECKHIIRIGTPHIRLYGMPDNEKSYQLRFHTKCASMFSSTDEALKTALEAAQEHEKEYGSESKTV